MNNDEQENKIVEDYNENNKDNYKYKRWNELPKHERQRRYNEYKKHNPAARVAERRRKYKREKAEKRIKYLNKYYAEQKYWPDVMTHNLFVTTAKAISEKCHSSILYHLYEMYDYLEEYNSCWWVSYDIAFEGKYMKEETDRFELIIGKRIPENNISYDRSMIKTLNHHFRYYQIKMNALSEYTYKKVIQILIDINIQEPVKYYNEEQRKLIYTGKYETEGATLYNTTIKATEDKIKNTIQNMSEEEINNRMQKVIDELKSYYLQKLYRLEKQMNDITTYLANDVYHNNETYKKVFSYSNNSSEKHNYDNHKLNIANEIRNFNARYK